MDKNSGEVSKPATVRKAATRAAKPEAVKPDTPKHWWQWLLVYPTVALAFLGGVPTYVEAFKSYQFGVPFGRSFDAQEQNRLWQENLDCVQKAAFSTTINKKLVEIGSAVCESGDVLLRGKRPGWDRHQLRWVSWDEVAPNAKDDKKPSALLDLLRNALAADGRIVLAQAPAWVICQRWVGPGQLLQRIQTPMGCYDQVINTYNGWVMGSRAAPCNQVC